MWGRRMQFSVWRTTANLTGALPLLLLARSGEQRTGQNRYQDESYATMQRQPVSSLGNEARQDIRFP